MVFRRSPHLVAYWRGDRLLVHNYRSNVAAAATPLIVEVLDACGGWCRLADLEKRFADYSPRSVIRTIRRLAGLTLIETATRRPRLSLPDPWQSWDPAAGLLHFSSKDLPYREPQITKTALEQRARRERMPTIDRRAPTGAIVALPRPQTGGEFARVVLERRTWRRFASAPMTLEALATLLGIACGVRFWVAVKRIGRFALKTYPSGGAQHPLEVYVVARNVRGLPQGLYRYAADGHRLDRVKRAATTRRIERYLPRQEWYANASALFMISAVVPRTQWKYRFPRAYKVVLAEAGHLCQNICLTATWLGLAPFCTMALADSVVERDLGIDGVNEAIIYAAGVGTRPKGVDWAPWPTKYTSKRTPGPLER
jgi:SagB-type dehydrogenase family enzyme